MQATGPGMLVREALRLLGVRNFVLGIHEPSIPSLPWEDVGHGSLASKGAEALLAFASEQGFNGLQLGPAGRVSAHNPSPYDGTLFSRSTFSAAAARLVDAHLLDQAFVARLTGAIPETAQRRVPYAKALAVQRELLDAAFKTADESPDWREQIRGYAAERRSWILPGALFSVLRERHGAFDASRWPDPDRSLFKEGAPDGPAAETRIRAHEGALELPMRRFAFEQLLIELQHRAVRERCAAKGIKLFADLQIGINGADAWANRGTFLDGYRMGAPPSRTNPDGQPWGYRVLDPEKEGTAAAPGSAMRFMALRIQHLLRQYDGVRIDHPHGLVCPWVYDGDAPDPLAAVQGGARLHESPDLPDHPRLAAFARVRPGQLDRGLPRHADGWVRELEEEQVRRYSVLVDVIVAAARAEGREDEDLVCEVLSTMPRPLAEVMRAHRLGRFRVTQKANLDQAGDVYRTDQAQPNDWVMIGNHDTPPIWRLLPDWVANGRLERYAAYLAERLCEPADRPRFVADCKASPGTLAQAMVADLLACGARHVQIFFHDLFGFSEPYNNPGTVSGDNWTLRVPLSRLSEHPRSARGRGALDIPLAVATALRARKLDPALAARLEATRER